MSNVHMWVPRDPKAFKRAGVELVAFARIDGKRRFNRGDATALQRAFNGEIDIFPREGKTILSFDVTLSAADLSRWFSGRGWNVQETASSPADTVEFARTELNDSVMILKQR